MRTRALFAALYLSEGAPIGFLWWFLPGRLREGGMAVSEITALSASLALPWALKWIWAPTLDVARTARWGYRHWMLAMQAAMVATLLPLAWLDPVAQYSIVVPLCVAHAVAAATQDVAIDALAIATVPAGERGALNGWMQAGMLVGRAAFGGIAIRAAAGAGLAPVVLALAALVVAAGVLAWRTAPPGVRAASPAGAAARRIARALRHAVWHPRMLWGLAFALTAGAGFEAVGGVASVFLVDAGYSAAVRGNFFTFASVPCMIAGALLGGAAADRWGALRAAGSFLPALAATIVLVAQVGAGQAGPAALAALALFYLGVGLFTAASYALFMDLTDEAVAATQFTAFMALTNGCEVWATASVGRLVDGFGYSRAFAAMAACSLLALPLLAPLRRYAPPPRVGGG